MAVGVHGTTAIHDRSAPLHHTRLLALHRGGQHLQPASPRPRQPHQTETAAPKKSRVTAAHRLPPEKDRPRKPRCRTKSLLRPTSQGKQLKSCETLRVSRTRRSGHPAREVVADQESWAMRNHRTAGAGSQNPSASRWAGIAPVMHAQPRQRPLANIRHPSMRRAECGCGAEKRAALFSFRGLRPRTPLGGGGRYAGKTRRRPSAPCNPHAHIPLTRSARGAVPPWQAAMPQASPPP